MAASVTVESSAATLINGIADRIKAAGVDQVKLGSLVSGLQSSAKGLSDAVTANTPAAPGGTTTVPPTTAVPGAFRPGGGGVRRP